MVIFFVGFTFRDELLRRKNSVCNSFCTGNRAWAFGPYKTGLDVGINSSRKFCLLGRTSSLMT